MADRPTSVEGVPDEVLDSIREQVLLKEQEQLSYRKPHGLRPDLKQIIDHEITEEYVD